MALASSPRLLSFTVSSTSLHMVFRVDAAHTPSIKLDLRVDFGPSDVHRPQVLEAEAYEPVCLPKNSALNALVAATIHLPQT